MKINHHAFCQLNLGTGAAFVFKLTVTLLFLLFSIGLLQVHADWKKHVLFIAVDDLTDTSGCYGDLVAQTPHIDALATSGVMFSRAHNQLPLCYATRASVMTGRCPDEIKV